MINVLYYVPGIFLGTRDTGKQNGQRSCLHAAHILVRRENQQRKKISKLYSKAGGKKALWRDNRERVR